MASEYDGVSARSLAKALNAKRNGNCWMACCPAHDDHNPSLSIRQGKGGKVLVKCHAGCSQEAVIDKLKRGGLWPQHKRNGKAGNQRFVIATYDYRDEHGDLLFQSVRLKPKGFFQRRPDGKGGWINNLKGVPRVPFRVRETRKAVAQGHSVFVVEGEKDVETLANRQIPATCNAGGAGKWHAEHAAYLENADVIIIPDNDKVGRDHAESVAASLYGIAKRIRVLELPGLAEKGDVSEWFASGGTSEKFWALAEDANDWHPPAKSESPPQLASTSTDGGHLYSHWHVEPWDEPVSTTALIEAVMGRIRCHVVMTVEAELAVALWILFSWVHRAAVHSALLLVTSPREECGKSTLLGLVKFLTPYGLSVVHMTAAVLYRMIEKWGPTLIIDEADLVFKNDPEIAAIINSGWTRGQGVPRCRPRTLEPEIFDTFCPKAIGMIGLRVPKATLSRAIIVELQRKINDQEVIDFDHVDDAELAELRRKLLRWAMDNADRLTGHRPKNPDGFANRLTANWRMMLAISELGGHQLAKKARGAAVALSAREDEADAGGLLLEHCKLIFEKSGLDQIAPFKLIDELCDDEEWPWATWWQDRDPITPRALALMLKNYGIRSKKSGRRAYCRKDFEEAWKRYL